MTQRIGQSGTTCKRRPGRPCALVSLAIILGIMGADVPDVRARDSFAVIRYNKKGGFDRAFGTGGGVLTFFSDFSDDEARAVALQPDGKIVVAGVSSMRGPNGFALVRYQPDGSPDPTFGANGQVVSSTDLGPREANALALQPDGKIVVAGLAIIQSNTVFALARYHPDGSLDHTFGDAGMVQTDFHPYSKDVIRAIALQPDGKIVAAGITADRHGSWASDFAVVRYHPNGRRDMTFGTHGKVRTSFGKGSNDEANTLALQPDGKIVVAGFSDVGDAEKFALVRYTPDGQRDPTFGTQGKVLTDFGPDGYDSFDVAFALGLQADGKIVAAGRAQGPNGYANTYFALVRYQPDGRRDPTFGTRGRVVTGFGTDSHDQANALAFQGDGKIVVAGVSNAVGNNNFALARYNQDGTLDLTLHGTGRVLDGFDTDTASSNDRATAVAIQTNGKIVAVGASSGICTIRC